MTNKPMYKACSRCGQIHAVGHKCYANSRNYYQHDAETRKFRNSTAWKKKAEEIKERDKYLCQVCLKKNIINTRDLSVHHIVPVAESQELRLENSNLITVCEKHHKECEQGKISRTEQQAIVDEIMKGY
jgi:5-methylcytosine-specific restriction endonuclease McrA